MNPFTDVPFALIAALATVWSAGYFVSVYQLIKLDAGARQMKVPTIWGLLGARNLLLYLFIRKKYRHSLSEEESNRADRLKKVAFILLTLFIVTTIALFIYSYLTFPEMRSQITPK